MKTYKTLKSSRKASRANKLDRKISRVTSSVEEETEPEIPMPDHQELQRLFLKALEEMAIPESNHQKLLEQSDEKKWEIIKAQNIFVKQSDGNEKGLAQEWITKLKERDGIGRPLMSVEAARELQIALRTGHRSFLMGFIESGGVDELNHLTMWFTDHTDRGEHEIEMVRQLVSMYKVLVNNKIGMEAALGIPGMEREWKGLSFIQILGTIVAITMCVDFHVGGDSDLNVTMEVMDLLSLTCWYNKSGRKSVLEAIQAFRTRRRETLRFQRIVYFLEHTRSIALKASITTFITNVCNSYHKLEDRVRVRNDFLALDIIKVFERILPQAKKAEDPTEKELWDKIKNQHQVFVGILKRDQTELMRKALAAKDGDEGGYIDIDMSNIDDVWNLVQKHTNSSGCQDELLTVAHALLFVPTENTLAKPIFEALTKYIYEATSVDQLTSDGKKVARKDFTTPPPLDYASLSKLYEEKINVDAKLLQMKTSEEIIERMSKKIEELKAENEKFKKTPGGAVQAVVPVQQSEDIGIMKEREKKLLYEIGELKKQLTKANRGKPIEDEKDSDKKGTTLARLKNYTGKLDSTGLIPAGIAPGAEKIDPPPCPKKGMPGSLENAPVKAGKSGNSGKREEQNKGPSAAELTIKKLGLPEKKPIKPGVKMTHIFWTPIQVEKLEGTIWPELSDQRVAFDKSELESLFGKIPGMSSKKSTGTLRGASVQLLDSTRKQNLGIALKKMGLKTKQIKAALLAVDDPILTRDTVLVLLETVPTEDEISILKKYEADGNDIQKLGIQEKFLYEISAINRLQERLLCIRTRFTFDEELERIDIATQRVRAAIIEVDESIHLRKILEILLAIGNYVNGGTPRGAAWGFKLDILPKLEAVKDNENFPFTRYLHLLFEKEYPELLNFTLPACEESKKISLHDFMGDLNLLAAHVQRVKTELEYPPIGKGDKFAKLMSKFEVKASKELSIVQGRFEKVRSDFESLAERFSETGAKVEPKTFFSKFVEFENALKRAGRQIQKERAEEQLRKKIKEDKQRRQTLMKLRRLQEQTDDPNLFEAFRKAQTGTSAEVAERFIERWKRDQKKKSEKDMHNKLL